MINCIENGILDYAEKDCYDDYDNSDELYDAYIDEKSMDEADAYEEGDEN